MISLVVAFISPPVTHAGHPWSDVVLTALGLLTAVSVALAARVALRDRNVVPLLAVIGGVIAVLNEPIYDLLGQIVYAPNQPILYTAFDRQIPVFLVFGYVSWVSCLGVYVAHLFRRGAPKATIYKLALASFFSVAIIETFGNSTHLWTYYGRFPSKDLGVAPQMAAVPILCGFLLFRMGPRLKGPAKALIIAVPGAALGTVYAATGWPMYVALNSNAPQIYNWLGGASTLILCASVVWLAAGASPDGRALPLPLAERDDRGTGTNGNGRAPATAGSDRLQPG